MSFISQLFPFMNDKKNNTGTNNTGRSNSGDCNSGHRNSGDYNSGHYNSGHRNSGDCNSGDFNSGYYNSGYYNSGHRNSGDYNSGHYNSGHRNSGDFNTNEPKMRLFNRECPYTRTELYAKGMMPDFSGMNPCVWIESSIMTDEEKKANPSHETTGGYIKTLSYKEAWAVWKRKCSKENWEKVLALPNFCPKIFEEITGIKVEDNSEAKQKAQQLEDEAAKLLQHAKELRSSL